MDPASVADLDPVGFETFVQYVSGPGIMFLDPN
jgi:hypothetical protein